MNITDPGFRIAAPLLLCEDQVHLWRVDLEAVSADEDRWRALLSSDELTRASRFHFSRDRQHYVASRGLLRMVLAGYLAENPSGLRFRYSKKEKPFLDSPYAESGVTFNLSHSGGIALLAFTRRREIGVDVEQVRHDFDLEAVAERFFSAQEQKQLAALPAEDRSHGFFRCWTRKEAYIKATGEGLSLPLRQFDVSLASGAKDALLATRPDASEAGQWQLQDVAADPGFVAALCVRGRALQLKDWSGNFYPHGQLETR